MKILRYTDKSFSNQIRAFNRIAQPQENVAETVRNILEELREKGDEALLRFTARFGGARMGREKLPVYPDEIAAALASTPRNVQKAILTSRANVVAFAKKSLRKTWFVKNRQGATVGERFDPLGRVGIYVPGGTAPLVSTAVMTVSLAVAAGVPEIVATTPCDAEGKVNAALLTALSLCGATEIYRVGGAQAVGALAYGTETIRPVRKIFGPGSPWVVEAKRQLFGRIAIDLLPGPSEVLVIADDSATPTWIAADLLAQSEHGAESVGILLTDSERVLTGVRDEISRLLGGLARKNILAGAVRNLRLILVASLADAARLANDFAPEHVAVATREPGNVAASLNSAGAIFLGGMTPVAAGDFLAGPSHTLPTGGAGKSFSGLTADQFQRRTSILRYDAESLERSMETIAAFGEMEGLDAHTLSAAVRLANR